LREILLDPRSRWWIAPQTSDPRPPTMRIDIVCSVLCKREQARIVILTNEVGVRVAREQKWDLSPGTATCI
jgi:hypothetical protein